MEYTYPSNGKWWGLLGTSGAGGVSTVYQTVNLGKAVVALGTAGVSIPVVASIALGAAVCSYGTLEFNKLK